MKKLAMSFAMGLVLLMAAPAGATPTVSLQFSGAGAGVSFSGTFDGVLNGSIFTLTNASGTQTYNGVTSAITGISPYAGADQLLSGGPSYVPDFSGVSFSTADNGDFNLFSWNGGFYELSSNVDPVGYPQNGVALTAFDISQAIPQSRLAGDPVPEPATWLTLIAGLVCIGFISRLRAKPFA